MLFDMMKEAEQKAGVAAPAPEPPPFTAEDEKVMEQLVDRIRHQILTEMSKKKDESALARSSTANALLRNP